MKSVLVIGNGGREHALSWKLSRDKDVDKIYCAPGNAGTSSIAKNIKYESFEDLIKFAKDKNIDLTVVGPEDSLSKGIVDMFKEEGLKIFGPDKKAARLESSKVFARKFMSRYKIPIPKYQIFDNYDKALDFLEQNKDQEFFIKADELCGGKGAMHALNFIEGKNALRDLLLKKKCGEGKRVLIEECLKGEEATILTFTDGDTSIEMPPIQDHKQLYDNDRGPNTGGMGAYAPAPIIDGKIQEKFRKKILEPTREGIKKEKLNDPGILYFGLLIQENEPYLLEYNVRFGDPEAQAVLPLLKSDLYPVLDKAVQGKLGEMEIEWEDKSSVCVVLSTKGYPIKYGHEREKIRGTGEAEKIEGVQVFHAGTKLNKDFYTHGGRILNVVGTDSSLRKAREKAYQGVSKIYFNGMHYRKDIGDKALKK